MMVRSSKLILEYEQVVSGRDGDDVLGRVPCRVKNLLIEVEAVDANFVLFPLTTRTDLLGLKRRLGPGNLARCLQRHIPLGGPVEHAEKVVVRARQDGLVVVAPAALELIEDAIILVQRAQLGAQVLMDRVRLDGLRLHVQVPHFNTEVVARQHISTRARKLHIRNTRNNLGKEAPIGWILCFFKHCSPANAAYKQREKK